MVGSVDENMSERKYAVQCSIMPAQVMITTVNYAP